MKQKEAEKTKQRKLRMVSHLQKDFINIPRGPSKEKKNHLLLPCLLVKGEHPKLQSFGSRGFGLDQAF